MRSGLFKFSYSNDPWGSDDKKFKSGAKSSTNDIDRLLDFCRGFLGGFRGEGLFPFSPRFIFIVILVIFSVWALSGFYTVNPEEEGVELVFGKFYDTTRPGLHYNFPSPIGLVKRVKVAVINREDIGYKSDETSREKDYGEGVVLTGDENIVNVNFEVQWRIKDSYKFLYKIHDAYQGLTVKNAAEGAMREAIGQNQISFILRGEGRSKLSIDTKNILQKVLDAYDMGVEVLSIQMKKVDPPEKVLASFRDVQSARSDAERSVNEAMAYTNDVIPRAGAEANKMRKEAEGYQIEVVNKAKGDAERFKNIYQQYKVNPSITRNRLLLDALEFVYKDVDKVIVDSKVMTFMNPVKN